MGEGAGRKEKGCRLHYEEKSKLAGIRKRRFYMKSSLRRTRTEIASLAGSCARLRFRLLQYLSCCKFDVPLIIQRRGNDEAKTGVLCFPFA